MWIEIEATEKGHRVSAVGVHHPELLVLAVARMGPVPANADPGMEVSQALKVFRRPPEGVRTQIRGFVVRTPEQQLDVYPAFSRLIQEVQGCAAPVWEGKRGPHEGNGGPEAVACGLDRGAYPFEGSFTVQEQVKLIALAGRVGTGVYEDGIWHTSQCCRFTGPVRTNSVFLSADGSGN
ncbi:hypothetical protein GCM10008949_46650 [Deinococcus humi]|nr:hypothetical protein GCM10008949_46650 [Deinococcus humi]